ncbi:RmlC-like cupin domain-containing protein [Xylariales sp. AK1849]|nr:RmlC-like cupin domain-containing protein [Xylariales sp. AK1849]
MHFSPAVAAAILGFSASVLAAPYYDSGNTTTVYAPTGTGTAPTRTKSATASDTGKPTQPAGLSGLSKTQQVFLSDTRVDALNKVLTKNEDFVFNFEDKKKGGPGKGGEIVPANRGTFPALTNTGVGGAVAFLGACGFNTPHVHPRATELAIVVEGTIVASMFPENAVNLTDGTPREILNTLEKFDATVFYQGSVHSQFNPNCEPAVFFAAFNSEDAGTGQVANELFAASNKDATAAVFGSQIDGADVDKLKGQISKNVALGVEKCLAKCGIAKRR